MPPPPTPSPATDAANWADDPAFIRELRAWRHGTAGPSSPAIRKWRRRDVVFNEWFRAGGHEAGHAVVALAQGRRVDRLVWGADPTVFAPGTATEIVHPHQADTETLAKLLKVVVAGNVGELFLPGAPSRVSLLSVEIRAGNVNAGKEKLNDWEYAGIWALELLKRRKREFDVDTLPATLARIVAAAEREAKAILALNHDGWRRLAVAMLDSGGKPISGERVKEIVGPLTLPPGTAGSAPEARTATGRKGETPRKPKSSPARRAKVTRGRTDCGAGK